MKISDLLRQLADTMERDDAKTPLSMASGEEPQTAAVAQGEDEPEFNTMVSPLQQKMELLKKNAGVDSVFDTTGKEDELELLKRNAGLPQKLNQIAADDSESA
jgi:hypothetical protein